MGSSLREAGFRLGERHAVEGALSLGQPYGGCGHRRGADGFGTMVIVLHEGNGAVPAALLTSV